MATRKQRETEELLAGKKNEIDALERRNLELEEKLKQYREREESIVAAMTVAVQTKNNIIAEAEKNRAAIIAHAEKTAEAKIYEANVKAEAIVLDAKSKATAIFSETNEKTKQLLTAAELRAQTLRKKYDQINETLVKAASQLYAYIGEYKEIYEQSLSDSFGDYSSLSDIAGVQPVTDLPDSYESPEELFHTFMRMTGRSAPQEVQEKSCAEQEPKQPEIPEIPNDVPFTDELLGEDHTTELISDVLSLADSEKCENTELDDSAFISKLRNAISCAEVELSSTEDIETAKSIDNLNKFLQESLEMAQPNKTEATAQKPLSQPVNVAMPEKIIPEQQDEQAPETAEPNNFTSQNKAAASDDTELASLIHEILGADN